MKSAGTFNFRVIRWCLTFLSTAVALALCGGCASGDMGSGLRPTGLEVNVELHPSTAASPHALQSVRVWVSPTKDARARSGSKQVGVVRATVSDMHSTELHLEKNVDELVNSALSRQLVLDGYRVVHQGQDYDYELGSMIRTFEFNVSAQDEIRLLMDLSLKKNGSEKPTWQAQVGESSDRFAGVTGNSRSTLSAYLERGIANWVQQSSAQLRVGMEPFIPRAAPAAEPSAASHQGWIVVTTQPANAKVYIDHVYFGKTPLRARIPQGVVALEIRQDGYKSIFEKVSIRSGETTELESTLNEI